MSNRIDDTFARLAREGRKAFIAYLMAGDPRPGLTVPLVLAMAKGGADIVELGIPFSDPLADGVVNQRAAERALSHGVSLAGVLGLVAEIRRRSEVPVVLFTYLNPVFSYGFERFAADAARAGADGVLSLDLPPEEAAAYERALGRHGVRNIFLVAPTTPPRRATLIARHASGFLYYVSRTGVTGEHGGLEEDLAAHVRVLRRLTRVPVAVGFGVATPAHVRRVARIADAVVVGSALVKEIERRGREKDIIERIGRKVRLLSAALGKKQ